MWWRCIILIWAIGVINFTILDGVDAYSDESPTMNNVDIQHKSLEEVLIFELRPKIMDVLRKEYASNFLIDRQHILPLRKSNSYPQHEFILEGRVTTNSYSDIVQITFKANFDGYKVSGFHVVNHSLN
ncbi:hypothetical protein AMS62_26620 [Bacillus sp. FJAT-18019]|uniref:DUF3888 domain-containing protein n=1 Tax=Paenibacillus solani TaxID=1705565 RepID=A0A0M1P412_9BACL|nr:hypothetical protein [Paenibacillus solani]KOP68423.1 hypothetical protein AMS62_26620 [Bacillus sp. FJAT-18019]KOR89231.1 hypothetical protein AM231_08720 [Paenibacillus solani]